MHSILVDPFFLAGSFFLLTHLLLNFLVYRAFVFQNPDCAAPDKTQSPVSVIISAKDEAANLKENLPAVLEQDYPQYEVIVVNDQSEDDTVKVLEDLSHRYSHLKMVDIEPHIRKRAGKKFAITMGIKKAEHEILMLIDADCKPASSHWIAYMQRHYQKEDVQFVIGYSGYETGSPLDPLVQYDTYHTALHYMSLGQLGMPYMAVGRNLSYRKSFFMRQKGFAAHQHLPAGDDDLFVNTYAHSGNTAFEYCPESFTISQPPQGLKAWWRQKRRHLASGKYYKAAHRYALGGIWLLQFLFYLSMILILALNPADYYAWGLLVVKLGLFYGFHLPGMNKLQIAKIAPYSFLIDLVYQLIYLPVTGLVVTLQKREKHGW